MDNQTAGVDLDKPGAHHLTPENIAATIKDLREIEYGTTSFPVENRDWRTGAGVLARIIEHLARRAEPSVAAGDVRALKAFCEAGKRAMRNYRMSNMICGDGDPCDAYPLVDLLSTEGESIATGEHEIELIVDAIYNEARAALASPAVSQMDGAAIHQIKSLTFHDCWHDVDQLTYLYTHQQSPEDARIVYASPAATTASASDQAKAEHVAWLDKESGRAQAPSREAAPLPPFKQDVYMVDQCMRECEPEDQRAWARIRAVAMGDALSQMAEMALAQQGASHAANAGEVDDAVIRTIATKAREFYLGYLSRHIPGDDIDAVRSPVTTDTVCRVIAFDLRAAIASSAAQEAK